MELRDLDLDRDVPELLAGMRDFISRMDYHDFLPKSEEELLMALARLLDLGAEVIVVEHEGKLVGGIGMLYAPNIWNKELLSGEELFFWTSREAPPSVALRLIRGARLRARERGCEHLVFKSLTSSPSNLDRVYHSLGLRPVELSYMGAC